MTADPPSRRGRPALTPERHDTITHTSPDSAPRCGGGGLGASAWVTTDTASSGTASTDTFASGPCRPARSAAALRVFSVISRSDGRSARTGTTPTYRSHGEVPPASAADRAGPPDPLPSRTPRGSHPTRRHPRQRATPSPSPPFAEPSQTSREVHLARRSRGWAAGGAVRHLPADVRPTPVRAGNRGSEPLTRSPGRTGAKGGPLGPATCPLGPWARRWPRRTLDSKPGGEPTGDRRASAGGQG